MKYPERHDILTLSREGRIEALTNLEKMSPEAEAALSRHLTLPVIYTGRNEADTGRLKIGISFPERICGMRIRTASSVSPEKIGSVTDPWSIPVWQIRDNRYLNMILEIRKLAAGYHIETGIYGAAAMEAVTGLNYLHENSDIDLVFRNVSGDSLYSFAETLYRTEELRGIRIDAEVRIKNLFCEPQADPEIYRDGYVKLKELVSSQSTVIVKGSGNPYLAGRLEVINHLS